MWLWKEKKVIITRANSEFILSDLDIISECLNLGLNKSISISKSIETFFVNFFNILNSSEYFVYNPNSQKISNSINYINGVVGLSDCFNLIGKDVGYHNSLRK